LSDNQKEVNTIIDDWNDRGYTCIAFQKNALPNASFLRIIIIALITILTLGFINLYTGPTLLFKLSENQKNST